MRGLIIIISTIFLFVQCKNGGAYEKEISVIDSTKVVLQVKLNELKRSEQNLVSIGFTKFDPYISFLKQNVGDTISKSVAGTVQQFINSGNTISQFEKEKSKLINQTELCISQLQKLSSDVKGNVLSAEAIKAFYSGEKNHAEELISAIEQNIKALTISTTSFKSALPRTEEYIRQINNGTLPTVVVEQNEE